jgi:hypothetical protein
VINAHLIVNRDREEGNNSSDMQRASRNAMAKKHDRLHLIVIVHVTNAGQYVRAG